MSQNIQEKDVVVSLLRIKLDWPFHVNLPCFDWPSIF